MGKRVMFTGGSGKAGRHVVQHLVESGHQVLNLDVKPLDNQKVRTLITDITEGSGLQCLVELYGSARVRPVPEAGAGRCGRALRRDTAGYDRA